MFHVFLVRLFTAPRMQPSRLLCPWDFPGENDVGCCAPSGVCVGTGFFPTSTTWEAQLLPDTILSIMPSPRMARLWVRAGTEMAFHVPWGPSARAWPVPWHKNPMCSHQKIRNLHKIRHTNPVQTQGPLLVHQDKHVVL